MKNVLKKFLELTKEAIDLNMPSYYTTQRDIELFYVKPEEMLKFVITELSPNVILRHGLIKGDIMLPLYKKNLVSI